MIRCWSDAFDLPPTEKLAALFVCMKLHDSATQGLLNRRSRSQHIPDKVFEALRNTVEKWHFIHYLAGLDFLQNTAMGPNELRSIRPQGWGRLDRALKFSAS